MGIVLHNRGVWNRLSVRAGVVFLNASLCGNKSPNAFLHSFGAHEHTRHKQVEVFTLHLVERLLLKDSLVNNSGYVVFNLPKKIFEVLSPFATDANQVVEVTWTSFKFSQLRLSHDPN